MLVWVEEYRHTSFSSTKLYLYLVFMKKSWWQDETCLSSSVFLFYKMFYAGSGFYSCIWTAQVQNTCWWPWCKILFLLSHLDNRKSKDCLLIETETHARESSVFVGTFFAYLPSIPNRYLLHWVKQNGAEC